MNLICVCNCSNSNTSGFYCTAFIIVFHVKKMFDKAARNRCELKITTSFTVRLQIKVLIRFKNK